MFTCPPIVQVAFTLRLVYDIHLFPKSMSYLCASVLCNQVGMSSLITVAKELTRIDIVWEVSGVHQESILVLCLLVDISCGDRLCWLVDVTHRLCRYVDVKHGLCLLVDVKRRLRRLADLKCWCWPVDLKTSLGWSVDVG